jgi:hypothetical protein
MSTVYAIQFTDSSLPGKTTFTIAPAQHDGPDQLLTLPPHPEKAHTTLTLFGQGALRYGQMIDDNFVHLLENFASDGVEPALPTIGQTWFDYSVSTLKVFTAAGWTLAPGNVISFNFNLQKVTLAPLKLYVNENQSAIFTPGTNFTVGNDVFPFTANNGVYQVSSVFFNSGTNQTEITSVVADVPPRASPPVSQPSPAGQVEVSQAPTSPIIGQVYFDYTTVPPSLTVWDGVTFVPIQTSTSTTTLNMNGNSITNLANSSFNINGFTPGLGGAWQISGTHASLFTAGDTIYVDNNTDPASNTTYTVTSASNSLGNTVITVSGTVPGTATISGNLANGTGGLNVASATALFLKIDGTNGPMTGFLNMGNHQINNMANPTLGQDAVTLSFANATYVNVTGDSMSGSLVFTSAGISPMDMGNNLIRNVTNPLLGQDAATRFYVLDEIRKAVSPAVAPTFQAPGAAQTAAYTFTGNNTPVGIVTPFGQGNIYIDVLGGKIWIVAHVGLGPVTSADWRQVYPPIYT